MLDDAFVNASFFAEQRFGDSVITARYNTVNTNRSLTSTSVLHPTSKLLVTELEFSGYDTGETVPKLTLEAWTTTLYRNASAAAAAASTSAGWNAQSATQWFSRVAIPNNTVDMVKRQLRVAVATKVMLNGAPATTTNWSHIVNASYNNASVGASCMINPGKQRKLTLVTAASTQLDLGSSSDVDVDFTADPLPDALAQLDHASTAAVTAANDEYWQSYWERSSISLPSQPNLERFWYVAQYMLSSVTRPRPKKYGGSSFPGLWGPWGTYGWRPDPYGQSIPWGGSYIIDYNTEAVLYGAFSSNKLEQLASYQDLIVAFLPTARKGALDTAAWASANFRGRNASLLECVRDSPEALHFPCGIGPFGHVSGGNGPSPGGDWELRWCGMFAAVPLISQWEYFREAPFGSEVLLPLLSGLADYWRCWLQQVPTSDGGYVLQDNDDNNAEQGWWSDCARGVGKGCTRVVDPMYSVGFLHRLFQTLPVLAEQLNETAPSWWAETAAHLPKYKSVRAESCTLPCRDCPPPCADMKLHCTCMNRTEFLVAAEKYSPTGQPFNDTQYGIAPSYVSNWPVHPAEHLDVDSEDLDLVAIARESAMGTFDITPTTIGPLMFPAAVRMSVGLKRPISGVQPGGTVRPLLGALNDWLLWTTTSYRPWQPWAPDTARGNLFPFLTPGIVGGIEEIGASVAINDMLLLSTGGGATGDAGAILRLFPVWRIAEDNGPAAFTGLRAKGGFVVSASYNNVSDEVTGVRVTSDAGVTCRILSPCAPMTGLWCGGPGSVSVVELSTHKTVHVGWIQDDRRGEIFFFATRPGATYTATPLPPRAAGWNEPRSQTGPKP